MRTSAAIITSFAALAASAPTFPMRLPSNVGASGDASVHAGFPGMDSPGVAVSASGSAGGSPEDDGGIISIQRRALKALGLEVPVDLHVANSLPVVNSLPVNVKRSALDVPALNNLGLDLPNVDLPATGVPDVGLPTAGLLNVGLPETGLPVKRDVVDDVTGVVGDELPAVDQLPSIPTLPLGLNTKRATTNDVEGTLEDAIKTLTDLLAKQKIAKRDVLDAANVPVVGSNNVAENLNVAPTVDNVISGVGGVLKRDMNIPMGSVNSVADNLHVGPTADNVISNVGGVLSRDTSIPVGSTNQVANDLELEPTVAGVISNLGGILKRADINLLVDDVAVTVGSASSVAHSLNVEPAAADVISNLGGISARDTTVTQPPTKGLVPALSELLGGGQN